MALRGQLKEKGLTVNYADTKCHGQHQVHILRLHEVNDRITDAERRPSSKRFFLAERWLNNTMQV